MKPSRSRNPKPKAARARAAAPTAPPAPQPTPAPPPSPALLWAIRALLAAAPVALAWIYLGNELRAQGQLGFPMDDPYIHFQFARNLASGAGFSFNPGEQAPGATSPLWVLLLAAGHALGAPLEWLSVVLGVGAAAAAAILAMEVGLLAGLPLPLAFLAGLATGTTGRTTWGSLSGMEPCLAAALTMLLLKLALSPKRGAGRYVTMGLVAGLCAQARPELLLLGLLVGAAELWNLVAPARVGGAAARPSALRSIALYAAAFAAVLLPYVLFCFATTGRPLPNTYYAKSFLPIRDLAHTVGALRARYLPDMAVWAWRDNPITALLLAAGIPLWALRREPRGGVLVLLWPLVFWAYALALFPRHFSMSRYTIPLLPAMMLLAMAPLKAVLSRLRSGLHRQLAVGVLGMLVLVGALRSQVQYHFQYQGNVDNILNQQVKMARWVAGHIPKEARVATNDIGAITYYAGRYCIDTEGLVSSDLIAEELRLGKANFESGRDAVVGRYVQEKKADYCILFPSWYPELTGQPWLRKVHEVDYENNTGGGNELVVYEVFEVAR